MNQQKKMVWGLSLGLVLLCSSSFVYTSDAAKDESQEKIEVNDSGAKPGLFRRAGNIAAAPFVFVAQKAKQGTASLSAWFLRRILWFDRRDKYSHLKQNWRVTVLLHNFMNRVHKAHERLDGRSLKVQPASDEEVCQAADICREEFVRIQESQKDVRAMLSCLRKDNKEGIKDLLIRISQKKKEAEEKGLKEKLKEVKKPVEDVKMKEIVAKKEGSQWRVLRWVGF